MWRLIEWLNGWLFLLFYGKMDETTAPILKGHTSKGFDFSLVAKDDITELARFLQSQPAEHMRYFKPHDFHESTLKRLHENKAFVMMKVRDTTDNRVVGYFFLRCFCVGKAFHGFVVGKGNEGRGMGTAMMACNVEICRRKGLRLFSTASAENEASLKASGKISDIHTTKQLNNGYMLIEWSVKTT